MGVRRPVSSRAGDWVPSHTDKRIGRRTGDLMTLYEREQARIKRDRDAYDALAAQYCRRKGLKVEDLRAYLFPEPQEKKSGGSHE